MKQKFSIPNYRKRFAKKCKSSGEVEFRPVCFISTAKIVINHKFSLKNRFQEILYGIDNWINERSGWIVESIESQHINLSTYGPLLGSSYVKLPVELGSPRKGLINIKNNDQKCFLWCHVRHVNPSKEYPERVTKEGKKLVKDLDYDETDFSVQEDDFGKTEKKKTFPLCILLRR